MKKLICLCVVALVALSLWAVPAKSGLHKVVQPDGTSIDVRLCGDENFNYAVTEDGYLVQQNSDGVYEYATFDANMELKSLNVKAHSLKSRSLTEQNFVQTTAQKMDSHKALTPAKKPGVVTTVPKVLVILANFTDVTFLPTNTKADFDNLMNGDNYTHRGSYGSVKKYFSDQSNGKYVPQFDVVGPVNLPHEQAYYGADASSKQDARIADLIMDACALAKSQCGVNFADYDSENDKFVDCVYVLYAGRGQNSGGGSNTVWPKNWNLVEAIYSGYAENYSQYVSGNIVTCPTYDGARVNVFVCSNELDDATTREGIGTFCHEFSHVLGMPDYYNTTTQNKQTPGNWSLMDMGMYNNNGVTPPNYSAYDKYYMGWISAPTVLNKAEDVMLRTDVNDYRMITKDGLTRSATTTDTTFYFENRQQTGWDEYLPGHGLMVTRVVYSSTRWTGNTVNNLNQRYDVIEADGTPSGGDAGDLFPGTGHYTSYTPFAAYPITTIKETDGVISFQVCGGGSLAEYEVFGMLENCTEKEILDAVTCSDTYSVDIVPADGYEILANDDYFAITMGGYDLQCGKHFTYDGTTLTIPDVSGDLEILVIAMPKTTTNVGQTEESRIVATSTTNGIKLSNLEPNAEIKIYDSVGRLIISENAQTTEQDYLLPVGIYVIRVQDNNTIKTLKIVR